ncbi:MAG: cation:proton antiporter subunit C [Marinicaulis sp.]|nr:cation:proton antiporter subunit C [Marinicaulis sp.]NNL89046.1 cation:proton antiporter subunit C [Marinicaulis sp.]
MDGWVEFALGRYNYWIVIVLMMTGLYIVFARGNLVKKVVGLNIFQTSVFIFYITIGKITGGTAPIYWKKDVYYGGDHGDGHGDGHSSEDAHDANATHEVADHGEASTSLHDKIDNDLATNDLKAALENVEADHANETTTLHEAPEGAEKIANDALAASGDKIESSFKVDKDALEAMKDTHAEAGADAAAHGAAYAESGLQYVYSNPLPHVLILTAIVVGVATTAVGLALAVRIREAYGTIEEDELVAMDNVAEFGGEAEAAAS